MTVLDHTAYPSIIDLIIEVAPLASLYALRTTSKTIRDRVHRHVLAHVELDYLEGATQYTGGELCLITAGTAFTPTPTHRLTFLPALVRTADQTEETPYPRLKINPYAAFTHLRTLRRLGSAVWADDASLFAQVHTLVDFIDMASYRREAIDHDNPYAHYEGSESDAEREDFEPNPYPLIRPGPLDYPPLLRRYVLHVHHDMGVWTLPPAFHQIFYNLFVRRTRMRQAPVQEVILVLHRSGAHPVAGRRLADALEAAVDTGLRYCAPAATFTLVGFNDSAATSSGVRARPTTRCLSIEEWLGGLGDRRRIEGEWVGRVA
ncbi:hypothetical protein Q8F55_000025 [Vanrija albida]|uniref:F-box domain-containing protein n=1 Tax=Vanrija albida TaxID=181172 RepID=A0ABR3QC43_9TREE